LGRTGPGRAAARFFGLGRAGAGQKFCNISIPELYYRN